MPMTLSTADLPGVATRAHPPPCLPDTYMAVMLGVATFVRYPLRMKCRAALKSDTSSNGTLGDRCGPGPGLSTAADTRWLPLLSLLSPPAVLLP